MVPDDHDEVDMNDYDPENDRQQHRWEKLMNFYTNSFDNPQLFRRGHGGHGGYDDDDDEGHGAHGPGVQCASQ